jgi:phospholipase C
LLVSKRFHKSGVDHADHDTTSIIKTIEERYRLAPLGTRDANVISLKTAIEQAGMHDD